MIRPVGLKVFDSIYMGTRSLIVIWPRFHAWPGRKFYQDYTASHVMKRWTPGSYSPAVQSEWEYNKLSEWVYHAGSTSYDYG